MNFFPCGRWSFPDFVNALQVNNTLKLSKEFFSKENVEHSSIVSKVQEQGHCLISSGKVAIVLALTETKLLGTSFIPEPAKPHEEIAYLHVKGLLNDSHRLLKVVLPSEVELEMVLCSVN